MSVNRLVESLREDMNRLEASHNTLVNQLQKMEVQVAGEMTQFREGLKFVSQTTNGMNERLLIAEGKLDGFRIIRSLVWTIFSMLSTLFVALIVALLTKKLPF
jgi:hypothetical protein